MVLTEDGHLYATGKGDFGRLGRGDTSDEALRFQPSFVGEDPTTRRPDCRIYGQGWLKSGSMDWHIWHGVSGKGGEECFQVEQFSEMRG